MIQIETKATIEHSFKFIYSLHLISKQPNKQYNQYKEIYYYT